MLASNLMRAKIESGSFNPSNLASTIAWFDGSDATTLTYNGSNQVSSWVDKISSIDVTRTASSSVVYNVSGGYLTFDNSQTGLRNTSTRLGLGANPNIFIAAVLSVPTTAEHRFVTIGDVLETGILAVSTDISWRFNNGNWITNEDVAINTNELLVWQRTANSNYGASTGYLNGTQLTQSVSTNPSNIPTNTTANFGIGNGFQNQSSDFDGDLYEIVICETTSSTDREKIEGYLAHKYSLDGNLPALHPYKSTPP